MPRILTDMTDPDRPVTRGELREELEAVLQTLATKEDLKAMRDELRTHFDIVAENFKSEFKDLHDWVAANVNSLATRVETIETDHGARLFGLETRMTRQEARPKRKS
jgi:uncharacterized membrane-anchored protein YhcB (DUF1043 family)